MFASLSAKVDKLLTPGAVTPATPAATAAELADISKQITAAQKAINEDITVKDAKILELTNTIAGHVKTIGERDLQITELTKTNADQKKLLDDPSLAANIKAIQIAQSQGVPPLKDNKDDGQAAGATALEQYNAMTDAKAKGAFYAKHSAAILANQPITK